MSLPSPPDPHAASQPAPARLRVGEFELNVAANELVARDGRVAHIEPRLMALLLRLAQTPGAVVPRETLIDEVWSRRMVNDEVLSRAVADLRNALGDDSRTPRYIETIPKSGYRLIAAVEALAARAAPQARTSGAVEAQENPPHSKRRAWLPAATIAGVGVLGLLAALGIFGVRAPRPSPSAADAGWETALQTALREARPLTASVGLEIGPRLSSDGKRVLYTLVEDGRARLMLHDAALPAAQRLSAEPEDAIGGLFLPDGSGVIYRALKPGRCMLMQRSAAGEYQEIAPCSREEPSRMDVSPDGTTLVLSKRHRESYPVGLALLDLRTGAHRQITTPAPADGEDTLPRFSPDGSRIAFVRGNSSERSVWLVPAAGGEARRLSALAGLTYGLAWVPDGKALVVAADWFGFRALNWLDARDGSGRLLGARGAQAPDLVAGRVVYENAIYQANLFRVSVKSPANEAGRRGSGAAYTGQPEPLHVSTRYTSQPAYSPDGNALAFISNREGVEALYVSAAGGTARRMPLPDTHRYMRPAWSADGKSIYVLRMIVSADKAAPQHALRVDVARGDAAVVPIGEKVAFVAESRDGRWLYFAEREERLMRLWRAPLNAPAQHERLALPLVGDVALNRDRIAYTQTGLQGITLCTLDGRSCELRRVPTGASHDDHWALTDAGLYFVEGERGERKVRRFDLKSGAVTVASDLAPATLGAGLAVHPREHEIIVAREQQPNIDLMEGRLPTPQR